jgi:hypothetical protein
VDSVTIVGTGAAKALITKITKDVYLAAKRRLRARREARGGGRHLGVTIYGPHRKDT